MIGKKPNVLFLDIETAPNLGYVWGKWEQDVIENERGWYILCFGYKWLGEKSVRVISLPDFRLFKKDKENDYEVMSSLWSILDQADVVVAHNGDRFDIPKINSRLVRHGFKPPSPFKTIDTRKLAKSNFGFDSNKLDDIGQYLNIGRKMHHTGFALWKGCMVGDEKSWRMMKKYNAQDVRLLERVYEKLRPWHMAHPNMNVFDERISACPICRSKDIQKRGFGFTTTGKRQRYQCNSCGKWSVGKIVKTNVEIR